MALLEKAYSLIRHVEPEEEYEEEYSNNEEEAEEEEEYDEEYDRELAEQTFSVLNRIALFGYSTDHMFL